MADPLLEGEIRSAFSMTEPAWPRADATNIATRIERDGDRVRHQRPEVVDLRSDVPRCKLLIVMGVTDPGASAHRRQSMILVPKDIPGVTMLRSTSVFGYVDGPHGGHAEIHYDNARVPVANLLGNEGDGFRSPRTGSARPDPSRDARHRHRRAGAGNDVPSAPRAGRRSEGR